MIRKSENSAASGEIEDCSAQFFFVIEHGGASSDVCEKSDLQTTSDLCYIVLNLSLGIAIKTTISRILSYKDQKAKKSQLEGCQKIVDPVWAKIDF